MELADFIRLGRAEPPLQFLKYGTREIYDTFVRVLRNP